MYIASFECTQCTRRLDEIEFDIQGSPVIGLTPNITTQQEVVLPPSAVSEDILLNLMALLIGANIDDNMLSQHYAHHEAHRVPPKMIKGVSSNDLRCLDVMKLMERVSSCSEYLVELFQGNGASIFGGHHLALAGLADLLLGSGVHTTLIANSGVALQEHQEAVTVVGLSKYLARMFFIRFRGLDAASVRSGWRL